jgi:zinc protease
MSAPRSLVVLSLLAAACAHHPPKAAEPSPTPTPAPEAKAEAAKPPELDRSKIPQGGPPKDIVIPKATTWTMPNGLQVVLVERHTLPLVAMRLIVRGAGTAGDPANQSGLASLTYDLADEAAGKRNATELATEIENLGASVSSGAGTDASYISAAGLKRVFDPVLGLFADVVLRPRFDNADFKRVKNQTLTGIQREREQGPVIARLLFSQALFGTHPYGSRPNGTQATVTKLERTAVEKFFRTHMDPARSSLIVVGDLTREELEPKLNQALGGWATPKDVAPSPKLAAPTARNAVTLSVFDRPNAAQSSIVVGWVGLERTNPDFIPTQVMNAIFGGLFNSRLNMNLREDKHWSYGARSGFDARMVPGPYVAGAEVQSDHTAESLVEIKKEIERMRAEPPSQEELVAARNALIRAVPTRFETVGGAAGAISDVVLYSLPLDYWEKYGDRVEAVTAEQVQAMAQKYLQPDRMTIVVAGDRAKIVEPIKELKLAPSVTLRDAEGKAQ